MYNLFKDVVVKKKELISLIQEEAILGRVLKKVNDNFNLKLKKNSSFNNHKFGIDEIYLSFAFFKGGGSKSVNGISSDELIFLKENGLVNGTPSIVGKTKGSTVSLSEDEMDVVIKHLKETSNIEDLNVFIFKILYKSHQKEVFNTAFKLKHLISLLNTEGVDFNIDYEGIKSTTLLVDFISNIRKEPSDYQDIVQIIERMDKKNIFDFYYKIMDVSIGNTFLEYSKPGIINKLGNYRVTPQMGFGLVCAILKSIKYVANNNTLDFLENALLYAPVNGSDKYTDTHKKLATHLLSSLYRYNFNPLVDFRLDSILNLVNKNLGIDLHDFSLSLFKESAEYKVDLSVKKIESLLKNIDFNVLTKENYDTLRGYYQKRLLSKNKDNKYIAFYLENLNEHEKERTKKNISDEKRSFLIPNVVGNVKI